MYPLTYRAARPNDREIGDGEVGEVLAHAAPFGDDVGQGRRHVAEVGVELVRVV